MMDYNNAQNACIRILQVSGMTVHNRTVMKLITDNKNEIFGQTNNRNGLTTTSEPIHYTARASTSTHKIL